MKKTLLLLGVVLLSCLLIYLAFYIYGSVRYNHLYGKQEKELAELFGINLAEYEQDKRFPYQYFYDNLQKGMTVREVHQVMRGYEKVLNCDDYTEVYYYFYEEDELAYRYQVIYDEGKYVGHDYGGLQTHEGAKGDLYLLGYKDGCVDGLLEE